MHGKENNNILILWPLFTDDPGKPTSSKKSLSNSAYY